MGNLFYDIKEEHNISIELQKASAINDNMISIPIQTSQTKALTENELLILQQLSVRRTELDKRQKELDKKEQELTELEKKLTTQQKKLDEIAKKLKEQIEQSTLQKNTELVHIYTHMKPTQAAIVLSSLDKTLILQILKNMPPTQAAAILEKFPPEEAKNLTILMASPNNEL